MKEKSTSEDGEVLMATSKAASRLNRRRISRSTTLRSYGQAGEDWHHSIISLPQIDHKTTMPWMRQAGWSQGDTEDASE